MTNSMLAMAMMSLSVVLVTICWMQVMVQISSMAGLAMMFSTVERVTIFWMEAMVPTN